MASKRFISGAVAGSLMASAIITGTNDRPTDIYASGTVRFKRFTRGCFISGDSADVGSASEASNFNSVCVLIGALCLMGNAIITDTNDRPTDIYASGTVRFKRGDSADVGSAKLTVVGELKKLVEKDSVRKGFCTFDPKRLEFLADNGRNQPRFEGENLEHAKNMYRCVNEMARKKGCTTWQLPQAWVQGVVVGLIPGTTEVENFNQNDVGPIPGTTKVEDLNQNDASLSFKLTT